MPEMGADDERRVFSKGDKANLPRKHNLKHEWIKMPEWKLEGEDVPEVCVWQIPAGRRMQIQLAVADGSDAKDRTELSEVMRVCEAVHDGPPPDGEPFFTILSDRQWLLDQPDSAIKRILNTLERVEGTGGLSEEDLYRFFAMMPTVVSCLESMSSASSACDDCPRKSSMECPVTLSTALGLRTESSANVTPRPIDSAPTASTKSDET